MKRMIKSVVALVLSVVLLAMLPISSGAESTVVTLPYNAEYFVKLGNMHTKVLPPYLYNGNNGNTASITGSYDSVDGIKQVYEFSFDETVLPINKNDVLEIIQTKETVTLSGNPAKYIGILANTAESEATSAEWKLTFDDESTNSVNVSINSMFHQGAYSYDYGKSLTADSTSGLIKRYNTEGAPVYLNLIEIKTDSIKNVTAVEFGTATSAYHVIGIVEIPYTQAEIDAIKNQATTSLLPLYQDKTLVELLDDTQPEDMENLAKLVGALDPTHEKYEQISNLYYGCTLYPAQKAIKDRYDAIMQMRNYLNETPETVGSFGAEDEANLDDLIALYQRQEESDSTTLENVMAYFQMIDDIFLDLTERESIAVLKEAYLTFQENSALLQEIETLYTRYQDKTVADLDAEVGDIENLESLIAKYEEADNKGISYEESHRKYIQTLLENYFKYQVSEDDYYYDLSSYFNKGFTANAGEKNIPDTWGTTDRFTVNGTATTCITGMSSSVWANHLPEDGLVVATSANYQKGNSVISPDPGNLPTSGQFRFKISTETDIAAKNVVELKNSSIVLPGSGKLSKNLNILSMVGSNQRPVTFEITVNYTDNTSKVWSVGFPYNGWEQPAVAKLDDRARPYVLNGEVVLSTERTVSRVAVLPIEPGKIIDHVVVKGASEKETECILLAVTEEALSNEEFETLLSNQYHMIQNYTPENYDIKELEKLVTLCNVASDRGIDSSVIVPNESIADVMNPLVIQKCDFQRIDADKVKISASVSMPNGEENLSDKIRLVLNGVPIAEAVFSPETMTLEAVVSKEMLENYDCNVNLHGVILSVDDDNGNEYPSISRYYADVFVGRENAIEDFKNAQTAHEVMGYLNNHASLLAIDPVLITSLDLEKAGVSFLSNKNLFDKSNVSESKNNIVRLLILSAFNQGKRDIVSDNGYFLQEDLMNYSSIDNGGVTIYSLYKTLVSEAGRNVTVNSLFNKNYLTLDTLLQEMAETMLINALEYPSVSGVGYVSDVLTAQNVAKLSLSISKYFTISDKTSINISIAGASIKSKADIEQTINNFSVSFAPMGGGAASSGGGGVSGGSSGVSDLGIDQPYFDSITNKNNEANGATAFRDVPKNHWAYEYIKELYEKKVLSGKGNGNFAPEDGLTRAELVKIIVTAKGLKSTDNALVFSDVPFDSWYAPFVKAAYENGIITGVTDTLFAPEEKISRQDLCVVLYRILSDKPSGEISFSDAESISPYAVDAVKCFANLGIVNGFSDGSFRATEGCTRAQCAKIISMFLQQ